MNYYPFTFAVFFQSILKPYMSVNNKMAKDILFAGKFNTDKSDKEYIAPGTFTDYTKGNRPIRATSISEICNMNTEEITKRIESLGLQDMPSIMITTKNLLEIIDISNQFRLELQSEAEKIDKPELYIAKIFQLSLKCPNTKRKLNNEDIDFLKKINESDLSINSNNSISENDPIEMTEKPIKGTELPNVSIDSKENINIFHGLKLCWQDIILPDDFKSLITYFIPFLNPPYMIKLDMHEIVEICSLDLFNKVCKDGFLKILEASFFNEILDIKKYFINLFKEINIIECSACIILIYGDISLMDVNEYASLINKTVNDKLNFIFGACYKNEIPNYIEVKIVFRFKNLNIPKFMNYINFNKLYDKD